MAHSFLCTNPSCGNTIEYTPGTFQIICPKCNTWHLAPTDVESTESEYSNSDELILPDYEELETTQESIVPTEIEVEESSVTESTESKDETEPRVVILLEDGTKFSLDEGKNLIGRKNADIVIDDKTISRKHCYIEVLIDEDKTVCFIYDVGHEEGSPSTNGVFVSGRSLRLQDYERVPLSTGTNVKIGAVNMQLFII
ncbi:MAG: pSer/pThr/pTyr-binding forkhead associated (FHA) protein [Flavobacteriales bacterium]|jgi:pSer/pThr/pTyr-binding forkhead associated (FHA) protein